MHRHPRRSPAPGAAPPTTGAAPVRCAADALAVVGLALRVPAVHETICFTLDELGCGGVVIAVEGTPDRHDALAVAGHVAAAAQGTAARRLVVASVRPDGTLVADDVRLWHAMSAAVRLYGIELVEWYVLDHRCRAFAPRALAGDPAPWPVQPPPHARPPGAAAVLGVRLCLADGDDESGTAQPGTAQPGTAQPGTAPPRR